MVLIMRKKNIEFLLKKYERQVYGEKVFPMYIHEKKQEQKLENNIQLLHALNDELPETLKIYGHNMAFAENLVKTFNNEFKTLHKQAKKEAIILSFIFFTNNIDNSNLHLQKYSIFSKYGLTLSMHNLIITRIAKYYMEKSPLPIIETTSYDHDLLLRNGGNI